MTQIPTTNLNNDALNVLLHRRLMGLQGAPLTDEQQPRDLAQGFALQQAISQAWCEQKNDQVTGWKCLLPSADKWVVAPIFASTIHDLRAQQAKQTATVPLWPQRGIARIEPELVFVLAKALTTQQAPYSDTDIDAVIASVHLGLELISGRFTSPSECSFFELLADGLFNQGLVVGPALNFNQLSNDGSASAIAMTLQCGEQPIQALNGQHQNQNAKAPLYWLVNFLSQQGITLNQGDQIITGSYAGVLEVPLATDVTIHYQDLASLCLQFSAM